MTDHIEGEQPQVVVPVTCERHRYDFLARRMKIGPNDTRLLEEVTLQILLFRLAAEDARIVARTKGNADNLSLVLAEIGCLACWNPKGYRLAYRCCQKGISHAAQVAQGKAADEGFPMIVPPSSEGSAA